MEEFETVEERSAGAAPVAGAFIAAAVVVIGLEEEVGAAERPVDGLAAELRDAGKELHVWTVNEVGEMWRLLTLGADNLIIVTIIANKLPLERRAQAVKLGLALAMLFRIALLMVVSVILKYATSVFYEFDTHFLGIHMHGALSGKALVLALGGAELFELGEVKGDLGALVMGVLISTHPKAKEMAKSMLGFKDLFLLGFFLSVGMSGQLSLEALIIGLLLAPFVLVKSALIFTLLTRFKLRARTSLLATLNLSSAGYGTRPRRHFAEQTVVTAYKAAHDVAVAPVPFTPAITREVTDLVQAGRIPGLGDDTGLAEHTGKLDIPQHGCMIERLTVLTA